MKTKLFISSIALAALTGCSSDDFIGKEAPAVPVEEPVAIAFGGRSNFLTRATAVGADAAAKLNNAFVVYGTKHAEAEDGTSTKDEVVYNHYQVAYAPGTAGSSETNTHNWEYVDKASYKQGISQKVKYWDLDAASGYTFYAFSSKDISYPAAADDKVAVTKTLAGNTVYDKGYKLTVKNGASLDDLYYADRTEVAKDQFGEPVVLTFRNFGARVRVGFYEVVPGYSVRIDRMYYDADASAAVTTFKSMVDVNSDNFVAALQNVKRDAASNEVTVTYYDNSVATVENQVKATNTTVEYEYALNLGSNINSTAKISTTAASPTWDTADGKYTTVYPFEANTNPMLIRLDYTLISDDGDAKAEEIHVKNARVVVPVQYVKWKSNYAYTYLFKISDNTNGTTGTTPTDPDDPSTGDEEGLFPITFDAVVIDATDGVQETISTLASNSVTTYNKGKVSDEYKVGETVYAVTTDPITKAIVAPTGIGTEANKAAVYVLSGSASAKATEADVLSKLTGAPNNITLTPVTPAATLVAKVPALDGTQYDFGANGALQFTPAAAGKYAYVYTTTAYVAPTYASAASEDFDPAVTYYFKSATGVYSAASGLSAGNWSNYKSQLYKQTAAGTAGDYTVKVITVK